MNEMTFKRATEVKLVSISMGLRVSFVYTHASFGLLPVVPGTEGRPLYKDR